MSEQRQQGYLQLIHKLSNCNSHDEIIETLAASGELVDFELLQSFEIQRVMFLQQGEENKANWCEHFSRQLKEIFSMHLKEVSNLYTTLDLEFISQQILPYSQLLIELLKTTQESKGDNHKIYPLLKNNIDKLDDLLAAILSYWGKEKVRIVTKDVAASLAEVIVIFSSLIEQFPLGKEANNIEIAISGYEVALTVYTQQEFPKVWAATQNYLAIIYSKRIKKGKRAENLEQSITYYKNALQVYTKKDFPQNWADTQHNLAIAYSNRIKGNIEENLEQAISCFQNSLKVYEPEVFPQDWSMTQHNLAIAYGKRIKGDRSENLEQAISCFQNALKKRTVKASPQDWANTQHNLAIAYRKRIKGDRSENLEQAISYFQNALIVYTVEKSPHWADVKHSLAIAYRERIKGDRAENLEMAIACFQNALQVYTLEDFPQDWAGTQNSLAVAYRERIKGDRAENLEMAIACFQEALKVYTKKDFPQDWAITQNNLAITFRERIKGDKAENLEMAIACSRKALRVFTLKDFPYESIMMQNNLATTYIYRIKRKREKNLEIAIAYLQKALKVYTLENFPQDWAGTQNNLAIAYTARAYIAKFRGEQAEQTENFQLALTTSKAALTVYTHEKFPQNYAETLYNIGLLYQEEQKFAEAYDAFASAITTVESLREEIVSGEESKRKQAEEWNKLYSHMVEVCLELGNNTAAIEYVERSKTRNLVEQILSRDLKTIFPKEIATKLEKLRDKIAIGQDKIQNSKAKNPRLLSRYLQILRCRRNKLQNRYLPVGENFKFNSFKHTLNKGTVIIEWYILNEKILAFIFKSTGELNIWQSQTEDRKALENWFNKYLQDYGNDKKNWEDNLGEELEKLALILHIDEILTYIPERNQLILIPHQFLHLLPLHALPVNQKSENLCCLLDLFPNGVSYAPSCQILQQVQQRKRPDFQSLFAIQNPTEDLSFTDLEVETILSYFPSHQVLTKEEATKAALSQATTQLKQANYLHFSCHGSFNVNSPQNSFLHLADAYVSPELADANPERYLKISDTKAVDLSKCLTLGNLFERTFDFSQTRLVVLSACETGLIDIKNTSDEYIGLPSGFIYAGSSSVVSSLWTVNDLSTSFLMIKFIQILQNATEISGVADFGYDFYLLAIAKLLHGQYFRLLDLYFHTLIQQRQISVPLAMNQAQRWLRDATKEELQEWVKKLTLDSTKKGQIRRQINKMTGEKPYNFPYHWAAFTAIGK
jgi:CHAT domain-containing protein/TPR repeat protein